MYSIYLHPRHRRIPILLHLVLLPLREPLAQDTILAQERVNIDIRALQPAVPTRRIKLPPTVHNTAVHEYRALALAQRHLPHARGVVEARSHAARRVEVLPQHRVLLDVDVGFKRRLERGCPVDVGDPRSRQVRLLLEHYGWPCVVVVVPVVLVVERYWEGAQCTEEVFGGEADCGGGAEGVCEDRGAAGDGVADAVQELEPRRGLEVKEVHVEGEIEGGVTTAVSVGCYLGGGGVWGGRTLCSWNPAQTERPRSSRRRCF